MHALSLTAVVSSLRAAGCVFAEEEADLLFAASSGQEHLVQMVNRRIVGEPLEYILGWADFCGLRISVDAGVFVPRRRTQFLAQSAIDIVNELPSAAVVVDLCCGSGAVGAAVLAARPEIELIASDISSAATTCAHRNLPHASVYCGDLFSALPVSLQGRVQVLLANAPYVPSPAIGLMPPEAREHEPLLALDGGVDGLDVQRAVLASASHWLSPEGTVLVETSMEQASRTTSIFQSARFRATVLRSEDLDCTVVLGTRG